MNKLASLFLLAVLSLDVGFVSAHHSFAVYFDADKQISVTGKVTRFAFKNPHGLLVVKVKNSEGVEEEWKAETNSPSILSRRGWTKDSLTVGETITIEGWPARNDGKLMRVLKVTRANGEVVGTPLNTAEQQK